MVALFSQMLDAGYWIIGSIPMANLKIIEYPETSIQDQLGLPRVFVSTQWLRYRNL